MKTNFFIILGFMLILIPFSAKATEFNNAEKVIIAKDQTINDNLVVTGSSSIIDGTVNGDLVVLGGDIEINGTINGDLLAAGGTVNVKGGEIKEDVRAAGGELTLNGKVGKDALIAGGKVYIDQSSEILGNVYLASGELTVAGKTGSIKANSGSVLIRNTAVINGNLWYKSGREADIQNGATIRGSIDKNIIQEPTKAKDIISLGRIIYILITILFALLFIYLFPNASREMARKFKEKGFDSVLKGFVALFVLPIAAIMLIISLVGMPLGITILLIYPVLLYIGNLVGIISIGSWISNYSLKDKKFIPWLAVVIGAIAYYIVGMVPFFGPIFTFLVFIGGIGTFLNYLWLLKEKVTK